MDVIACMCAVVWGRNTGRYAHIVVGIIVCHQHCGFYNYAQWSSFLLFFHYIVVCRQLIERTGLIRTYRREATCARRIGSERSRRTHDKVRHLFDSADRPVIFALAYRVSAKMRNSTGKFFFHCTMQCSAGPTLSRRSFLRSSTRA